MNATASLASLQSTHPLPEGWASSEAVLDEVVADGLPLHRAGLSATAAGHEVNGAAVGLDDAPVARAYFELVERASTLAAIRHVSGRHPLLGADGSATGACAHEDLFPESDDPTAWRYARSNGVAVHVDWPAACLRAHWELAERDRVLRAWYGEIVPEAVDVPRGTPVVSRTRSYAWRAYRFAAGSAAWSSGIEVAGVFGFPRDPRVPLVYGYGARPALADALACAVVEATQLLGFLWGETIPEHEPELAPTALFHLERYLRPDNHALIEGWLAGAHVEFGDRAVHRRREDEDRQVRFVDLAPHRAPPLRVAKAVCSAAVPLTFGVGPLSAHLPPHLRVHPVA